MTDGSGDVMPPAVGGGYSCRPRPREWGGSEECWEGSDGVPAIGERLAVDERQRHEATLEDGELGLAQTGFAYLNLMHAEVLYKNGLSEATRARAAGRGRRAPSCLFAGLAKKGEP